MISHLTFLEYCFKLPEIAIQSDFTVNNEKYMSLNDYLLFIVLMQFLL